MAGVAKDGVAQEMRGNTHLSIILNAAMLTEEGRCEEDDRDAEVRKGRVREGRRGGQDGKACS